ncbi:hypothetical protein FACS189485_09060 [Spirochaetia bacterium]|nr:hypothetical protein FACS189485_09060 [Spirochaetia bacterium]
MNKNIIIAGVPRAGKSTISHILSKKYGYQHISMDSIIAGFEKIFPETGINTYAEMPSFEIMKNISNKISKFISAMYKSGEYDEFNEKIVIDIYQLLPDDYVKNIGNENFEIYYFITSNVTAEERFQILKENDNKNDYTYYYSDEENRENCFNIVEQSKIIKGQCVKNNLPYFETAKNREQIFEEFIRLYVLKPTLSSPAASSIPSAVI